MKKYLFFAMLFLFEISAQLPSIHQQGMIQMKMESKELIADLAPIMNLELVQNVLNDELNFYAEFDAYHMDPMEFFLPGILGKESIGFSKTKAAFFSMTIENDEPVLISCLPLKDVKAFESSLKNTSLSHWTKEKEGYFHDNGKSFMLYDKSFVYLIERKISRKVLKKALKERLDNQLGEGNYDIPMLSGYDYYYEALEVNEAVVEEYSTETEVEAVLEEETVSEIIEFSYEQQDSILLIIKNANNKTWLKNYKSKGSTGNWNSNLLNSEKAMALFLSNKELSNTINGMRYANEIQKQLGGLYKSGAADVLLELYTEKENIILKSKYLSPLLDESKRIFGTSYESNVTKYLPKEQAYLQGGFSINNLAYYDFLREHIQSLPDTNLLLSKIKSGYALFDLIFDEKAMSQLITGDAYVYSCGSITDSITRTTYEYNENFEYEEKTIKEAISLPKFYVFVATQNEEAMNHVLNLSAFPKYFEKDDKEVYTLNIDENIIPMYARVHDGLLMFTNDQEFVYNPIENESTKKMLTNHFVWDLNTSMDLFKEVMGTKLRDREKARVDVVKTYFDRIEMDWFKSTPTGYENTITLSAKNKNEAFFMSISKLITELTK